MGYWDLKVKGGYWRERLWEEESDLWGEKEKSQSYGGGGYGLRIRKN